MHKDAGTSVFSARLFFVWFEMHPFGFWLFRLFWLFFRLFLAVLVAVFALWRSLFIYCTGNGKDKFGIFAQFRFNMDIAA